MGESKFFSNFLSGLSHQGILGVHLKSDFAAKIREIFFLSNCGVYYGRDKIFSLIFCWVYHTRGFLGDVYECARQIESIVGTFDIGFGGKN